MWNTDMEVIGVDVTLVCSLRVERGSEHKLFLKEKFIFSSKEWF